MTNIHKKLLLPLFNIRKCYRHIFILLQFQQTSLQNQLTCVALTSALKLLTLNCRLLLLFTQNCAMEFSSFSAKTSIKRSLILFLFHFKFLLTFLSTKKMKKTLQLDLVFKPLDKLKEEHIDCLHF